MKKIFFLIITLVLFSCQKKERNFFDYVSINDIPLENPKPGEWRFNRNEKKQSYEDYSKSKKIIVSENQHLIYLQPYGDFDSLQQKSLKLTQEYLHHFFQLEVRLLKSKDDNIVPKSARRTLENNEQLLAGYFLDPILKNEKNENQIVCMAITEKDLYPKPEWNYVFGLASYQDGIGVTSIHRLQNIDNFNGGLLRILKISSHEIGHMFGLAHCQHANCVMNGTNSLYETDHHSSRLCSDCQRKLQSSLKYDNQKRLSDLKVFFTRNSFQKEANQLEKDAKLFE